MRQTVVCEITRDKILNTVGHLLQRYGYKKMTVDDIAHEAGVGKGTVYLFFPSKEEVALSWMDRSNQWMRAELREIADSEANPAERIRSMLLRRVLFRFDGVQQFSQGIDELFQAMRPTFLARRSGYHHGEAVIFADVLEEGQRSGIFDVSDAYETAHALLLATNSLLPYSLSSQQLGDREEIEMKTLRMADIILKGVLRRS